MAHSATRTVTERLPGLQKPRLGSSEKLLLRLMRRLVRGQLAVEFPSGATIVIEGKEPGTKAILQIRDMRLALRALLSGDIGFAESYMEGEWDTPDLKALLMLAAENADSMSATFAPSFAMRLLNRWRHARRANTRQGSRRNIAAHYDLGNAFYRQWLDETMTYSSAIFEASGEAHETAQRRKYIRLAELLDIRPGDHVLEIGCGWGGFAEIAAAEFGCRVTGLTLSQEQASYARDRIARAGLEQSVDIRIQDYRDVEGQFDHIVSIEMFEAVGEENWPTYFQTLERTLKPGGKAALQVILIADRHFAAYRKKPEFIQRYIFPGGMLPSAETFNKAARYGGFAVTDDFRFGKSYGESLRRWNDAFMAHWDEIEPLGFDERFRRMWHYYLKYCEAGFDHGRIDVAQFLLQRN